MRVSTLLRRCLRLNKTVVKGIEVLEDGNLLIEVRPRRGRPRCGLCGQVCPGYDRRKTKRWRHLLFGKSIVYLTYAPRRVQCRVCGVRNEQVPWGASDGHYTWEFEELTAYLTQGAAKTLVAKLMAVAWVSVGAIVGRVVHRNLDPSRLKGLRRIGIDEFSYRKRHRYVTVVVDHDRRRVVWAGEGRSAESLQGFFEQLGPAGSARIETVTMDMAAGYIKAVQEALPHAKIVFDRFHVQQLASRALDDVRRRMVRALGATAQASQLKGLRYVLLRHGIDLDSDDIDKLEEARLSSRGLYRAYRGKEELVAIFDETDPRKAERLLRRWLAWAARSRLPEFVKVGRTIRKHFDRIMTYFEERLTNGLVEGFNNKLRVIARRAFGFHSSEALIAMLYLISGGIILDPVLPKPTY